MNYFHHMVDNIHQKRSWRPWNQRGSICLHLRRHIWNSRVHERSVTSSAHEGTPAWTKAKPSSSRRSHQKTYRPAEERIYHSCVELAIFIGKGSVHLKFSFWTHRMINFVVATGSRACHDRNLPTTTHCNLRATCPKQTSSYMRFKFRICCLKPGFNLE